MENNSRKIIVVCAYTPGLIIFQGQLLRRFVDRGFDVIVCGPEVNSEDRGKFADMKVNYINVPMNRTGLNPYEDIIGFFSLLKIISQNRPEKILTTGLKAIVLGSLAPIFGKSSETYSMFQGLGHTFTDNSIKVKIVNLIVQSLCRISLIKNKSVFFLNPDDLKLFVDRKIVRKRQAVLVNGCGVDLDEFKPAEPQLEGPVFLMIARLLKDKGIMEYVEAAKIIKKKYPEARIQLLGPFDSNPSLLSKETIDTWCREGAIEYLGETNDVRPFIAKCSVYVLPSYREGVPRSVMEAMAMARPIIVTDVPGCRETIVDEENGFMVPSKDSQALANAMERFIRDPKLIEPMGLVSRKMVEERFDVHKVNKMLMNEMKIYSNN